MHRMSKRHRVQRLGRIGKRDEPKKEMTERERELLEGLSRIAKYDVWRTLKLLEKHPCRIKEITNAGIKKHMLYRVVLPRLREIGAIVEGRYPSTVGDEQRRPYFAVWLTEKGVRLVKALDHIKELVGVMK